MFADVSREMLATCEAQLAGREVGAVESLPLLLLLGRRLGVASNTVVFRSIFLIQAFIVICHVYILRVVGLVREDRPRRVLSFERRIVSGL